MGRRWRTIKVIVCFTIKTLTNASSLPQVYGPAIKQHTCNNNNNNNNNNNKYYYYFSYVQSMKYSYLSVPQVLFAFSYLPCPSIPYSLFSLIPVDIYCIHEFRILPFLLLLLLLLLLGGHHSNNFWGSVSSLIYCTWSCQFNCLYLM